MKWNEYGKSELSTVVLVLNLQSPIQIKNEMSKTIHNQLKRRTIYLTSKSHEFNKEKWIVQTFYQTVV